MSVKAEKEERRRPTVGSGGHVFIYGRRRRQPKAYIRQPPTLLETGIYTIIMQVYNAHAPGNSPKWQEGMAC
jgi:hypothetical protein